MGEIARKVRIFPLLRVKPEAKLSAIISLKLSPEVECAGKDRNLF